MSGRLPKELLSQRSLQKAREEYDTKQLGPDHYLRKRVKTDSVVARASPSLVSNAKSSKKKKNKNKNSQ